MVALHLVPLDDLLLDPGIDDADLVLALPPDAVTEPGAVAALESAAGDLTIDAWFTDITIGDTVIRRPSWSPTRLVGQPGAASPLAVRAGWLRAHDVAPTAPALPLRLAAARATVAHLPVVLTCHETAPTGPDEAAVDSYLEAIGVPATVRSDEDRFVLHPDPGFAPRVSVVIPTAGATVEIEGRREVAIDRLLSSIGTTHDRVELIAVVGDEYRGDPTAIGASSPGSVTVVRRPSGPFNFSAAVNLGVLHAHNDLVLLLNDDMEADGPGFIDAMAMHLCDPSVAAVGARLLYPDGTIQHTGIIIDDARPLHPFLGWSPGDAAVHGADVARDVIAVTGGCLMLRRADFLAVGGLSTGFPLSFNDVDLCIRLRRSIGRVVVEPAATLMHHETLSRTPTISADEWDRWIGRWGEIVDPWYHPGFRRPDDPHHLNRNADHLDPGPDALPPEPVARTTTIRSSVHRGRHAPVTA